MSRLDAHDDQLLALALAGVGSPDQLAELNALLATDDALLDEYIRLMKTDAALHWQHGRVVVPPLNAELAARSSQRSIAFKPALTPPRTPTLRPPKRLALAAALLLAAAAVAVYLFAFNAEPETRAPKPDQPVATILDTTGGSTLLINDAVANSGDDALPGDYALDTGSADFRLTNGVEIALRGQTQLTVHSPMSATLTRGEATFDCPHAAVGYTVQLPGGSKVVDLGTRFSIRVGMGGRASIVRVTEGKVTLSTPQAPDRIVVASEVWRIAADGSVAAIDPNVILDGDGAPTPFSIRLPGTGAAHGPLDPNMVADADGIELRSTRSDLRGAIGLDAAQFIGVDLRRLADSAPDADITVQATFDRLPPATADFDSYGVFVGASADAAMRAGILHWDRPHAYRVTTIDGGDRALNRVDATQTTRTDNGELLVLLRRVDGVWSATVGGVDLGAFGDRVANPPADRPLVAGVFVNHTDPASAGLTVRLTSFTARVGDRTLQWQAPRTPGAVSQSKPSERK